MKNTNVKNAVKKGTKKSTKKSVKETKATKNTKIKTKEKTENAYKDSRIQQSVKDYIEKSEGHELDSDFLVNVNGQRFTGKNKDTLETYMKPSDKSLKDCLPIGNPRTMRVGDAPFNVDYRQAGISSGGVITDSVTVKSYLENGILSLFRSPVIITDSVRAEIHRIISEFMENKEYERYTDIEMRKLFIDACDYFMKVFAESTFVHKPYYVLDGNSMWHAAKICYEKVTSTDDDVKVTDKEEDNARLYQSDIKMLLIDKECIKRLREEGIKRTGNKNAWVLSVLLLLVEKNLAGTNKWKNKRLATFNIFWCAIARHIFGFDHKSQVKLAYYYQDAIIEGVNHTTLFYSIVAQQNFCVDNIEKMKPINVSAFKTEIGQAMLLRICRGRTLRKRAEAYKQFSSAIDEVITPDNMSGSYTVNHVDTIFGDLLKDGIVKPITDSEDIKAYCDKFTHAVEVYLTEKKAKDNQKEIKKYVNREMREQLSEYLKYPEDFSDEESRELLKKAALTICGEQQ